MKGKKMLEADTVELNFLTRQMLESHKKFYQGMVDKLGQKSEQFVNKKWTDETMIAFCVALTGFVGAAMAENPILNIFLVERIDNALRTAIVIDPFELEDMWLQVQRGIRDE
jgi:hypothetical protein